MPRRRHVHRLRALLLAAFLLAASPADAQLADPVLQGTIDLHLHSAPDTQARSVTDLEAARLAKRAGLRAVVLKNHYTMTADRAVLTMLAVDGIEVFGGIVLNRAVGGLNAEAVRRMTELAGGRGKIVWLPTRDASLEVGDADRPAVAVVQDGAPAPELAEIFALIAANDLVLATGHAAPEEVLVLLPAARRAGIDRILITHILDRRATIAQMKQMIAHGAILELVSPASRPGRKLSEYIWVIRTIGAEHFVLSSDLGQYMNPLPTDGFKDFIVALTDKGLGAKAIDQMTRSNPARLLGLEPAP